VLEILERRPNRGSLEVALKAMQIPTLHDEASRVAMEIAQKLGARSDELKGLAEKIASEPVSLEIVKAEYGAGDKLKDVTEVLKKQAGKMRWIVLPSTNYNQSFGGDPAPNVVKQLKVQYRINDKPGQATFAENTLVVLPMPN
jgi:hypothetical protein